MKKFLLTLALAGTMFAAYAQKPDADMQKAVDKALAATQDAKKNVKPATWMNLGKAYLAAYNNPTANLAQGIDRTTFSMMFKEQPQSGPEVVEMEGQQLTKVGYSHVDVLKLINIKEGDAIAAISVVAHSDDEESQAAEPVETAEE